MALIQVFADTCEPGTCRSCNAPITWATLRHSGRRMPFDGELEPERTFDDDDGRIIHVINTAITLSHFATCPHAAGWRKPKP